MYEFSVFELWRQMELNSSYCLALISIEETQKSKKDKNRNCQETHLGLNQLNDGTDRRRVPHQDEEHPGNDPHLVPDFPRLCSGMLTYLWV